MIKHSKKAMNMLKKNKLYWLAIFAILSAPTVISAQTVEALTHKEVMQGVIDFVEAKVNPEQVESTRITVLPIDSRIKFYQCSSAIKYKLASDRSFTRQFPVKVSCDEGIKPWKTYIQVVVSEMVEALVVTKNIAKGVRIDADMLKVALVDKFKVKARSISSIDSVLGGRAMRNISRGYQIGLQDVCLVCKGDDVSIIAKSGSMMIKTSGTAIENGAKGETIKVQNSSSQRIVKGVIGDLREIHVKL